MEHIELRAFEHCMIDTFIWPPKCTTIPRFCFCDTRIKGIYNIGNVETIGEGAFCNTKHLSTFAWPLGCTAIPEKCFLGSSIRKIHNLWNVQAIGARAFAETDNLKTVDLSGILTCRIDPSAFHGKEPDAIIPPFYDDIRIVQNLDV